MIRPDHRQRSRRLVLRFAAVQSVATIAAAVATGLAAGRAACGAALIGGLIVTVGNVVFGWRLFAPGVAPVRAMARAAYAAEVLKWLWLVGALAVAAGPMHMGGLPLVAGMLAAQMGFWVGLAIIRRA